METVVNEIGAKLEKESANRRLESNFLTPQKKIPKIPRGSKVACLDLEGTIVEGSIWRKLNEEFGVARSTADDLLDMFLRGMINYENWANTLVEAWRLSGGKQPTKENILKHTNEFEAIEGGPELIDAIKNEGYFTISISGAPDIFTKKVSQEFGIDVDVPTQELVFNENGLVSKVLIHNDYDFSKHHILRNLRRENDVGKTIGVGDSMNDEDMCRGADKGYIVDKSRKELNYEELKSDGVFIGSLEDIRREIKS